MFQVAASLVAHPDWSSEEWGDGSIAGPTHPTVDSRSYPSTVDICHLQAGCDACHCYRPIHAGEVGRETLGKDKILAESALSKH